ncbi:MAG: hypothetical protein HY875_11375 [Chloroflexi bacterium]|nr:hypothetical protein [Chloroflexota bacterium]
MHKLQRIALATGALAAFAGVIGTGVVLAQDNSGTSSATTQSRVDTYIAKLASNLGITEQALRDALKQTGLDMVTQAVADGKITQAEADAITAKINAGEGNPFGFGMGGHGGPGGKHGAGVPGMGMSDEGVATFLGIDHQTLHDELSGGKTLAQVAEAHGKSRDALRAYLIEQNSTKIDEAVANGRLTAEQAATAKENFASKVDTMIDSTMPQKGEGGRHGGMHFGGQPSTGSGTTAPANVQ